MCCMYFKMSMNEFFAKMMLVPSFKLNFKIGHNLSDEFENLSDL